MVPMVDSARAAKPVCDPAKRRAARVLTQADVPVGANFAGVDLRCGDYSLIRFEDVNLSGANLDGATVRELINVTANGASFVGAIVGKPQGKTFLSGSFQNTNFSNALVFIYSDSNEVVNFDRANLTGAQIMNNSAALVSMVGANLSKSRFPQGLKDADLSKANLQGVRSRGPFVRIIFVGANFSGSDLRQAKFLECDLSKVKFGNAMIQGADFFGSTLLGADLTKAKGKAFGLGK